MTRYAVNRRNLVLSLILTASCGPIGPVVTEPMPDIPETVEYDTVRIEYGDDDLLVGSGAGALVGSPAAIASVAQTFVRGTNAIIRGQIQLIETATRPFPTEAQEGLWVWHNFDTKGSDALFSYFEIREVDDGDITYEWRVGETQDELLEVFSGEFHPRARFNGRQRGLGILRFNFDNMHRFDPESNPSAGRAAIAFRSIGGVRQVRVASFDVVDADNPEPHSGAYEYVQFRDGAGRFRFGAETDFLKDGAPLENLAIDTVWTPTAAGRALASLTGGSLIINEVLLEECWDDAARTTFADATPDVAIPYEDGDRSACDPGVVDFMLSPPDVVIPQADPEIPPPHSDEEEEIIVGP